MELHEHRSHHATKDLTLGLTEDRYGNLTEIKGRGFRHVSIYELINDHKRKLRCWIEDTDRNVLWQAGRRWHGDFDPVLTYRDAVFPGARVIVWDEEEGFVLWDETVTVTVTVTSKRKKK